MLSKEYRESIERRFHAFYKAVLHNEACNYYRERKRRYDRAIKCKADYGGFEVPTGLPAAA